MPPPNPTHVYPETLPTSQLLMLLTQSQLVLTGQAGRGFCNSLAFKLLQKDAARGYPFFLERFGSIPTPTRLVIDALTLKVFPTPQEIADLPAVTHPSAWGAYLDVGIRWVEQGGYYEVAFYLGESVVMMTRIAGHIATGISYAEDPEVAAGSKVPEPHHQALCSALQKDGNRVLLRRFTSYVSVIRELGEEEALFDDRDFSPHPYIPSKLTRVVTSVIGFTIEPDKSGNRVILTFLVAPPNNNQQQNLVCPSQLFPFLPLLTAYLDTIPPLLSTRLRRFFRITPTSIIDYARPALTSLETKALSTIIEAVPIITMCRLPNPTISSLPHLFIPPPIPNGPRVISTNVRHGFMGGLKKGERKVNLVGGIKRAYEQADRQWVKGVQGSGVGVAWDTFGEQELRGYRVQPSTLVQSYHASVDTLIDPSAPLSATAQLLANALKHPWDFGRNPKKGKKAISAVEKVVNEAFNKGWFRNVKAGGWVEIGEGAALDLPEELMGEWKLKEGDEVCVWIEPVSLCKTSGLLNHKVAQIRTQVGRERADNLRAHELIWITHAKTYPLLDTSPHSTAELSRRSVIHFVNDAIMNHRRLKNAHVTAIEGVRWQAEEEVDDGWLGMVKELGLKEVMQAGREMRGVVEGFKGRVAGYDQARKKQVGDSPLIRFIPTIPHLLPDSPDDLEQSLLFALFNGSTSFLSLDLKPGKNHHVQPINLPLELSPRISQAFIVESAHFYHAVVITPKKDQGFLDLIWEECLEEAAKVLRDAIGWILDRNRMEDEEEVIRGMIGEECLVTIGTSDEVDSWLMQREVPGFGQTIRVQITQGTAMERKLKEVLIEKGAGL